MSIQHNKQIAEECAVKLTERASPAELLLKEALIEYNVNFEFQKPLYSEKFRYIADFFIIDQRLIVELDGSTHNGNESADTQRSADIINHYGYDVIRFKNKAVFKEVKAVLSEILNHVPRPKKKPKQKAKKSTSWKNKLSQPKQPKAIPFFYELARR
jgi:very-short-patch-repair endonuclease